MGSLLCGDSRPLISICIPAYNSQNQLNDCLDSVAAQEFKNFEVVVVDDGSQLSIKLDKGVLKGLDERRVKLVRQHNQGAYAARQRAIEEACGTYIFCVDSDDELANSQVLGEIAEALNRNSYPDVLVFNAVREDGKPCFDYSNLGDGEIVSRRRIISLFFSYPCWNSMCCIVFRRSLIKPPVDRPRLLMAEDGLQKAEVLANATTFALLDRPLYLYRETEGSTIMSPFKLSDFYDRVYVGCEIRKLLDVLDATVGMWACLFNISLSASLVELARDTRCGTPERLRYYEEFRGADGCEEALEFAGSGLPKKDRVCLLAFRGCRWLLLDRLLKGRCLASRIKNSLPIE